MRTEVTSPIADLASCHAGILTRLDTLSELPALRAAAAQAHDIAQESLGFFGEVIFQHHLEEERELFPAVMQAADATERHQVKSIIDQLIKEHAEIEQLWRRVEPGLRGMTRGQFDRLDDPGLAQLVQRYKDHAHFEETEFLPLANRLLERMDGGMTDLALSLHKRHSSAYARAID